MNKIPCILLVDDDETANYLNFRVLTRSGMVDETLISLNGKEALKIINNRFGQHGNESTCTAPMLVLLDVNMPIMNGLEFMKQFSMLEDNVKLNVKVIALTTSTHPTDLKMMMGFGVEHFISKPLKWEELEMILSLN